MRWIEKRKSIHTQSSDHQYSGSTEEGSFIKDSLGLCWHEPLALDGPSSPLPLDSSTYDGKETKGTLEKQCSAQSASHHPKDKQPQLLFEQWLVDACCWIRHEAIGLLEGQYIMAVLEPDSWNSVFCKEMQNSGGTDTKLYSEGKLGLWCYPRKSKISSRSSTW